MPLSPSIARLALLEVKLAKENIAEQLAQYKRDCEADRDLGFWPQYCIHGVDYDYACWQCEESDHDPFKNPHLIYGAAIARAYELEAKATEAIVHITALKKLGFLNPAAEETILDNILFSLRIEKN